MRLWSNSILGKWPNTYAFTKALSENLIRTGAKNMPIGMFRPAIVTSSAREPVVGWIDNLNGPTGVIAGAGTGILRTLHCNPDVIANIVPVDMTVNALICSAWDVAVNHKDRRWVLFLCSIHCTTIAKAPSSNIIKNQIFVLSPLAPPKIFQFTIMCRQLRIHWAGANSRD